MRERAQNLLMLFPNLRAGKEPAGSLKVTRYWTPYRLEQFRDGTFKGADVDMKDMVYREGRLWTFVTFRGNGRRAPETTPQFIFAIDLKTFATAVIPFEEPPPLAAPRKDHWASTNVEVSPEAVFVSREW